MVGFALWRLVGIVGTLPRRIPMIGFLAREEPFAFFFESFILNLSMFREYLLKIFENPKTKTLTKSRQNHDPTSLVWYDSIIYNQDFEWFPTAIFHLFWSM